MKKTFEEALAEASDDLISRLFLPCRGGPEARTVTDVCGIHFQRLSDSDIHVVPKEWMEPPDA